LPISITGWATVAPPFADNARRYVAQVDLSLRPATTKRQATTRRVLSQ
jgi:hypothetical protein